MAWDEEDDTTIYKVVVNHEEQYSIWPADRDNALGWNDVGRSGPKAECLAYIEDVWTDMRPLSLRQRMEELAREPAPEPVEVDDTPEDSVVTRLAEGRHRVVAGPYGDGGPQRLKEGIDRGYVHLQFPDTRGGTELGVRLDPAASDLSRASFDARTGTVHLEGTLVLDYVKVRCIADIDLASLAGHGHLEIVEDTAA